MSMHDGSVLDLGADLAQRGVPLARARRPMIWAGATLAGLALAAGAFAVQMEARADGDIGPATRLDLAAVRQVEALNVDDKAQILDRGETAEMRNAAIPLIGAPLDRVSGFAIAPSAEGAYATALKCLSMAVYYEAAVEPMEGRRAVAQVVLNRMRHPAYPKSVCGVVYQGSERRTGCQFSFTCDGSLLRTPSAGPWRMAQEVARQALAGYVEESVGTATHYHADYVLPKWAFELGKITKLGRHIFYRFQGGWGRASALSGRYAMIERIPTLNLAMMSQRLEEDGQMAIAGDYTPGLTVKPHITDRHAASDIGGRIDPTREWRLTIPDPVAASSRYRATLDDDEAASMQPTGLVVLNAAGPETGQP